MALQGKTTVIKRGNTADNNLLLGAKGEIVVNETTKSLRVHTGTRGGTELLRSDMANLDTGVSSVLDFNGARLRDIGSPVASTDAATKAYVDANSGGGSSTLSGLTDVALGGTITSGELLQYDGSAWINSTISLSDLSDSSTVATKTYVDTGIGNLGSAANYNVGTDPNNVVKLDGSSRLPAVDGSLLTGVNISGGLLATNNLSELTSTASVARTNLELGNVATLATGTDNGQVPLAENVALLSDGKISTDVLPSGYSKDVANGIAGLDNNGLIPSNLLPNLSITNVSSGLLAERPVAGVGNKGDVYITTDTSQTFISDGSSWKEIENLTSASVADLISDMTNLKGSIGDIVDVDSGGWDGFGVGTTNYLGGATSLKDALDILDNEIYTLGGSLITTLSGLTDVALGGTITSGELLKYNGTDWVNGSLSTSDLSNGGEIPLLVGGTITASLNGNALTSSSWLAPITLNLSGTIITGSVSIDGSGEVDLIYDVTPSSITGGMIASNSVSNSNLEYSSVYLGSHTLSLGGTLGLSGLSITGNTLSVNTISLDDLSDVEITGTPSNNQVLKYDTGTSKWVNGTSSASVSNLDDIGDVATGGAVDGDILKYDGSHWVNKKPSIALNYVALTDASITLASGKYYVYSSATDTTQKNTLTLPSNAIISNTGGETIYVSIVDSIADTNNNYVLKAGTNTRIIYEDVILAESSELALSSTGLYTITHVIRDGEKRYYVTLNKSVSSNSSYTDSDAVDALVNALDDTNITYTLSSGQILSSINTNSISNDKLIHSSITIGSSSISLGGTLALSGLSFDGSTLSVNSISLNDLSDVALGTLSTGQVLKYDGTNWVNGTDNTGGGVGLSDTNVWTGTNEFQNDVSVTGANHTFEVTDGTNTVFLVNSNNGDTLINGVTTLKDNLSIINPTGILVDGTPVYLYVKYGADSIANGEYFHIFKTSDGGSTREVIPLTLLQDGGQNKLAIKAGDVYEYQAVAGDYANASNVPNASFVLDTEGGTYTYQIKCYTANDTGTEFEVAFSLNGANPAPTYSTLFTLDNGSAHDKEYLITYDSPLNIQPNAGVSSIYNQVSRIVSNNISTGHLTIHQGALKVNDISALGAGTLTLSGNVVYTTQPANTNNTTLATTAYVDLAVATVGGGGGDVYLANANVFTNTNTFNGSYLLVESVSGEDKFKVNNSGNTIDMFTPITLVQDAYLYVKFDSSSWMSDFFYVFTSPDNGITRQVVPLTLIQDSGTDYLQKITSWSMGGTYTFDYSVYSANGFMDYTNANNVPNASFKRDPSLTYYISSWNRNQFSTFDFGLAISDSNDGLNLTYVDLAGSGFDSNMVEKIYEVVDNLPTLDATLDGPSYTYDRRTTKVANFDKAYDLTTLARLEVTSIAEVGKLIVNGSTTLGGAIDLGSSGTATTPSANDNSTLVATTAYVQTELSAMVLNDLSDTTVFSPATGETLRYNGSAFVNSKLSFSDLSSTGNAALLTADNNFTGNLKSYGGNLNVYNGKNEIFYLFVKYNSTSRNDAEYFYVFSSSDNGVTRESVPLTLIQDTGTDYLEEDTSQGYKRYLASQASAYTNTGTSANAAVVLDMSKTYYFTIRTDNDNTSPNLDFQIYISDNINATGFTYNNVLPYGGGFYSDDNPYTITINSSAWSTISLSSPTSVTNASGLSDSAQVLSIDNDTGNIVSNGYIQLKEQGSVPTPVLTYAQIYAKVDVSDTEIYVQDSAGNNTKLSPHNEEGEWEYYSYNKRTGKAIRINMEKMIRTLEAITGEKFIIEE